MKNPIIIGAGVSGLVAAIELEKAGFAPIILEATNCVGGRVKSDILKGFPADHGFQVLLTEYPEAQRYLSYDQLDLVKFKPGSVIFKNGELEKIGDPLRDASFLWSTTFANVGSINDKRLILKLSISLKRKSIKAIFAEQEIATMAYLEKYGFSEKMIHDFFRPFFAGIYLEEDLNTSSRMFEFVYKMFATGYAAIPRKGMQAIPNQLSQGLKKTDIRFNSSVSHIEDHTIHLENGESLTADHIIIATDPAPLLRKQGFVPQDWKSCYNLYFESPESILKDSIIGLIPMKKTLINNLHFLNDVFGSGDKTRDSVLSVTVVKNHNLLHEEMVDQIRSELLDLCNIKTGELLKFYHIKKALPIVRDLKYEPSNAEISLAQGIYCCGDFLANSSLNAAMASGRVAANLVINLSSILLQGSERL